MSYNQLLNKTLQVQSDTAVSDGMGGQIKIPSTPSTVKARVSPASANTVVKYQALGVKVTHTVYLQPGANVKAGDRLILGSRVLRVHGPKDPDEMGHHLEVLCEEVQ